MATPNTKDFTLLTSSRRAPALITAGLAIQILAALSPAAPVVLGMTLVALGATLALISRLTSSAALTAVVAANLFIYLSLYLLFVTAICQAAMTGPQNGLSIWQGFDFGLSVIPMAAVVRASLRAISTGRDAAAQ